MTDDLLAAGRFASIPNLRILVDGRPRGIIETRDYERWEADGTYSNWWWITLRRDDGIWVEGSATEEFVAPTMEELEAKTRKVVDVLLARKGTTLTFEAIKGDELPERELPPEGGEDPEDGSTSEVFAQVDALVCS